MSDDAGSSAYWLLGSLVLVHISGDQTDGRFSLVEFRMPPDWMTPLHTHQRDSQTTYVLDGEVTIYLPGSAHVLRPGECIHQPRGVPQTERVSSGEPARVLDINSPSGFERFIAALGEPAESLTLPPPSESPPDPERIAAVAAEHGIELLGPPGALP